MDLARLVARKVFRWKPKPLRTAQELGLLPDLGAGFTPVEGATFEIRDVTVKFGNVVAVDSLSIDLRGGGSWDSSDRTAPGRRPRSTPSPAS